MKIAIINQRYGIDINGGSEYYTRCLAEHLQEENEVTVLTTNAGSYKDWAPKYPVGEEVINSVKVIRFPVVRKRRDFLQRVYGKLLCFSDGLKFPDKLSLWMSHRFVMNQGPVCPKLIDYLEENVDEYDVFIFVTYLYYPTVYGLLGSQKLRDKSVLIPTAHDEFCIYMPIFKQVFNNPKGLIFLTEEERDFVHKTFVNASIPNMVCAMGIDTPENTDNKRFREKYGLTDMPQYLIYAGRIDVNKGCDKMIEYFLNTTVDSHLVLLGEPHMDIPVNERIHALGFVSEEDKFDAMSGASALILPSEFESLSIAVLEAMSLGKPVIVNGKCEVLKGHVLKSSAGFYFEDEKSFGKAVNSILGEQVPAEYLQELEDNAKAYVEKNYTWDSVLKKYSEFI